MQRRRYAVLLDNTTVFAFGEARSPEALLAENVNFAGFHIYIIEDDRPDTAV